MMLLYIEEDNGRVNIYSEQEKHYSLPMRCHDYLNYLCESYGSSLNGRKQAACTFLQIRQKVPIYIREGVMLFQSIAASTSHRIWINYRRVKQIVKECYQTRVIFMDYSELLMDMDYRSARMQMRRCVHFDYMLAKRLTPMCFETDGQNDRQNTLQNEGLLSGLSLCQAVDNEVHLRYDKKA